LKKLCVNSFSIALFEEMKTVVVRNFFIGFLFLFAGSGFAADDFTILRLAWAGYFTGGTNLNLSDPIVSGRMATIGSSANSYWTSMNKSVNRTYLWSNAAGWSSSSADITTSYYRLSVMSQGWATKGSSVYSNATLAADIISALDWMYTNVYNEHITQYDNWWDWEIGSPNDLNKCMVLMYPLLLGTQITNYCKTIDHFTPSGFGTGANRVWFAEAMGVRGVVGLDGSKVAKARDILSDVEDGGANNVFAYVTSGDGFYRDGSYIQHGDNPYTGGYGASLLQVLAQMVTWLAPSQWAVTDPLQTNEVQWCYNSFEPMIHEGAVSDDVRGRGIAGSSVNGYDAGHQIIGSILRIAQAAPVEDAARLNSMVKYWGEVDPTASLTGYVDMDLIPSAEQLLTNASVVPRGELVGHYQFPSMDRVEHRRPGFAFGLSLFSSRISNYEYINLGNAHGWYTGSGMDYIYSTNDPTQYTDNYWPTVDPYHLAGTTVNQKPLSNGTNADMHSSQNWVGGASLSSVSGVTAGVAGMSLADVNSSLEGKKSWFMFNDEIVCLGAGITCGSGNNVQTTVENWKISNANTNTFIVDGGTMPATLGWNANLLNVHWCALSGAGGYYFPGGAFIEASRSSRTGSWADIAPGSSSSVTRNYLTLVWEHGINPVNSTYAYVLLPNRTAAATSQYAANPTAVILTNSPTLQAVSEPSLGILAANFWSNGPQTVDMLTASNECSIITKTSGDLLEVDASDPTWTNAGSIKLALNSSCLSVISADSGVTVSQLSPTVKLSVNVNGARGKTFRVQLQRSESPLVTLTNTDGYGNTSFNIAGNWSDGQAPDGGKDYSTTPFWTLRSPASASSFTFAGNSLTLVGSGGFDDHLSLMSKQTDSSDVLTFNQLIFTNLAVFHNAGTGGPKIGLAGNIIITNGGGALAPADGDIIVSGSVTGNGPLWVGDTAIACVNGVIFSGSFSNFTGSIYATNLGTQLKASTAMLTFSNSVDQVYSGDLVLMHLDTFTNAVTKAGAGTLTLTGNNTYDGITSVNAGTLLVNGFASATPVLVTSGATLGGTGSIGGMVTINAGGTLAPGADDIGTLLLSGGLTLNGNLAFEVNNSVHGSNDFCQVTGTLINSGNGTLTISNSGPVLAAGDSFTLFNKPLLNGGTLAITPVPGAGLMWTNKLAVDGSIAVVATVASNPTNIIFSVSGNTLNLSWPADHLGWIAQSNSVNLADPNTWFDIPNSQNGTNLVIQLNPTMKNVFFRLRQPN
jgi:hyaluronate lyase